MTATYWLLGLGSTVVSWTVGRWVWHHAHRLGLIDRPNARSSHDTPTPRGGGLGISILLVAASFLAAESGEHPELWILGLSTLGIALVGWRDDRTGGLSATSRFFAQALLASLVVWRLGAFQYLPLPLRIELGLLGGPLTVLWIVGVTNVFNFLDGIDGYAGLQGLLAGVGLVVLGSVAGGTGTALVPLGVALGGSCLGFLALNWPPARIFMGDVGAVTIGFVVSSAPLVLPHPTREAAGFTVGLLLWFFLSDGAWTFLHRALRGQRVWEPHREHLYQRLCRSGWSQARVTTTIGFGMTVIGVVGLFAFSHPDGSGSPLAADTLALMLATLGFMVYYLIVRRAEASHQQTEVEPGVPDHD